MPDPAIRGTITRLCGLNPMPPPSPQPDLSQSDRMNRWLHDPILYAEAVAWFEYHGWIETADGYIHPSSFSE